jgi:hypothetical protein
MLGQYLRLGHYHFLIHPKALLAYFPYFEKIKVGLCDHHAACVSVYPHPLTFEWLNQSL